MSIEVISLEYFSALPLAYIKSTTPSRQHHAVFNYFLSDDSRKDAATTFAQSKRLISFLKDQNLMTTSLSTIRENTDGCAEQYICASDLHITSVMSQCYFVTIYQGISPPSHVK